MSGGKLDDLVARRFSAPLTVTAALVLTTPLLSASSAPGGWSGDAGAARPAAVTYNACTRNAQFYAANPLDNVLSDKYKWATYPVTTVGDGKGDINWKLNPYKRVSWSMWLHSLRWLGAALDAANRGDQQAADHLLAVVRDWTNDNPYPWNGSPTAQEATMHRTNVLLCLRTMLSNRNNGTLPDKARWLDDVILTHAKSLQAYFSGYGNHGTDESLAMLGVGCLLDRADYRNLAGQRLLAILDQAIYPDGSVNEQSTGYASFNYSLWSRTRAVVRQCTPESRFADTVDARLSALATFLAHAMTPQRTFHQLGDTEDLLRPPLVGTPHEYPATDGASGRPPANRVAVYRSGYVFGRSGWGTPEVPYRAQSAYSIRFGTKQQYHGHADHMSLTYQAKGAPILIDPGYGEYTQDGWQKYVKGPTAHNQLVIPGMTSARTTALARSRIGSNGTGRNADYFQLRDIPGTGMARTRDVIVLSDPDLILVADRGSTKRTGTFQQLWHLPPRTTVTTGRYAAVARSASSPTTADLRSNSATTNTDVVTTFLRLSYRGARVLPAVPVVTTGSTRPVQGWWWPTIFSKQRAPVVSMAQRGTSATMLTAVVPGRRGTTVRATAALAGDKKTWVYTFTVAAPGTAGQVAQVAIRADGSMLRIR